MHIKADKKARLLLFSFLAFEYFNVDYFFVIYTNLDRRVAALLAMTSYPTSTFFAASAAEAASGS